MPLTVFLTILSACAAIGVGGLFVVLCTLLASFLIALYRGFMSGR